MKILFLIYHGFSSYSGISKKIIAQAKGMIENGHQVNVCIYTINEDGHRIRLVGNNIIADYGTGKWAALKKRFSYQSIYQYAISQHTDIVYIRSYHNANPFTIDLFKKLKKAGIKIALEIPTYPYDTEYNGCPLFMRLELLIDKLFRRQLASHTDAIITYSDYNYIFGQRTIKTSNGVDFDSIPLKKEKNKNHSIINLIGVAEVHYWHGYDRLINGLGKYYQNRPDITVYFHIVGEVCKSEMYDSKHAPGFHELITKHHIEKYIIFHGPQMGEELDDLFDNADFAIGSLGRHRSHIDKIKTLKNREYAARGLPFIYSEIDEDFDHMPYVLKAPADESAIDIKKIIDFYHTIHQSPGEIRDSIQHLSWKNQMNFVISNIK